MNSQADSPCQTSTEHELPVSVVMDLLSNRHRRRALLVLSRRTGTVQLDELAESIASTDGALDPARIETLRVELRHCHLPKLADAGLLHFDRETNRVRVEPRLSSLDPLLDAVQAEEGAA